MKNKKNLLDADKKVANHWQQFGAYLRQIRESRQAHDSRWTQQFVADKAGLSRQTLNSIENGMPTKRKTVLILAEALQVQDTDELLRRAGFAAPPSRKLSPLQITILANLQDLPEDLQDAVGAAVATLASHQTARNLARKRFDLTDDPDSSYNHAEAPLERPKEAYAVRPYPPKGVPDP